MNEIRLIKNCPKCGKQLRFPIDRGTIKVKCPCGYSFAADPDNTDIYKNARFDLSNDRNDGRAPLKIKEKIIKGIWQYRYNLQNIRLLTGKARRNVIVVTALIALLLFSVISLIIFLMATPKEYVI